MNDHELRALVRDAVARHLGTRAPSGTGLPAMPAAPVKHGPHGFAGHAVYLTLVNTGEACVIEPSVACDHCGYCKSHGH